MSKEIYHRDRRYKGGGYLTIHGKLVVGGWLFLAILTLVFSLVTHGIAAILVGAAIIVYIFTRVSKNKSIQPPPYQQDIYYPTREQIYTPPKGAIGERQTRHIPQAVKVAVSARDGGRCVECYSSEDLHFDHKVPWSRGGTNTLNNIQLLCGNCNRRKSAKMP